MNDVKESTCRRICFVCRLRVAGGDGCYHAHLRILTHNGICMEFVISFKRVYDRSKQGRWRPREEVLDLLREHRPLTIDDL